ncbi:M20/M25/M40 family metallo-hydrolase [Sphingosinicella sp. YJ22]|uniref:M20/M25/M40 family metallo-hydrolase n=1 Tax=Sphingosinicella sp. YJ22 TaxID=1104780 RepID=UPI00140A68CA|nr:M20/M25/M40 family metallo-hydrolase [Sphingosinicella sp. YJ22]
MGTRFIGFAGILLALLAVLVFKGALVAPPAVPEAAAPGAFDAARAFARLERILADRQPHPVDSAANDRVRNRLVAELGAAGLQPRVTDTMTCSNFADAPSINCARVRNVVVTIGPAEGRHLLLVSHYDSNGASPGAADDGIGVASMIEIAALLRGEQLRRPVTFLFNEGEETGLNGARAFLDSDPVARQVDTLINLEARGTEGPAIMFETSRPNAGAIAAFTAGSRRPFANSLSTDFYRLIPNSTDVAVFEDRPWTILNYAIIGNETRYHSPGDELAALDRRSLHHMGSEALGAARAIAVEGVPSATGERIYADFYGLFLVVLPLLLGLILLGLLILFFALLGWRRKALGLPLLTALAAISGAGLLAFAVDWLTSALRPGDYWRGYPLVTFAFMYVVALSSACAALLTIGKRADRAQLRIAAWLLFLLAGALACLVAPGAAIYFIFPPLLVPAGILLGRVHPAAGRIGAIAAALLLLVTFAEILHLIELLLIDGPYWILAPLAVLATLPLLVEARPDGKTRPLLWGGVAVAAVAWAAVLLVPRSTPDRQQLFTIEYIRDDAARWAISNKRVGLPGPFEAMGDWALTELPYSSRRRWTLAAPALPVPAPAIEAVSAPAAEGRLVTLTLRANGSNSVALRLPPEVRLLRAGMPGQALPVGEGAEDSPSWVRCVGRSCDGMRLELLLGNAEPVDAQLIGTRAGLPREAQPLVAARPANSRPQYGPDSTIAIARVRL